MKLSVLIPVYNERTVVARCIALVLAAPLPENMERELIVVDDTADRVAAVVEVKYLTAEDASDRVRSAVIQLVRYARLYHPISEIGPLLGRSLIAVSQGADAISNPSPVPADTPLIVDFAAIRFGQLGEWIPRLRP